jgi:hypothetical protein
MKIKKIRKKKKKLDYQKMKIIKIIMTKKKD